MKITRVLLGAVLIGGVLLSSCNKEEDPGVNCGNWSTKYAEYIQDLAAAATDYQNNPSTSTCNSLIDAYTKAINSLQDFIDADCIPEESQAAVQQSIDAWNNSLDEIDCSSN